MGARPEHGVLSHALTLSANGVDVGEVDEVVEDAAKGVKTAERERKTGRAYGRKREREKEDRIVQGGRPGEKRREKAGGGEDGGKDGG